MTRRKRGPLFHEGSLDYPKVKHHPITYYIADLDAGIVKIGTTVNLHTRVPRIMNYAPELKPVFYAWEYGGQKIERRRHASFSHYRLLGEWFFLRGELEEYVNDLRRQIIEEEHEIEVVDD